MIQYQSKLVEDDTVSIQEYISNDELNNIDNVVVIEGPNDFGKSILLHCIALSAYGLEFFKEDKKKINEELKKKLDWLIDTKEKFSKLEYNLEVTYNRAGREIKFTSNKSLDKREIETKLNDNYSSFQNFKKDFNLLYDIPSNPTKRLDELLDESVVKLNEIHTIVEDFNNYLTEINDGLNEDPEEKLKKQKEGLTNLEEERDTAKIKYDKYKQKLNSLKNYQVIKEYDAIIDNLKDKEPRFKKVKSKLDTLKGAKETKSKSKSIIRDFYDNAENYNEELLIHLRDIGIDDETPIKDQISKLNNLEMAQDIQNNEGNDYSSIVHEIKMYCSQLENEVVNQDVSDNVKFLIALKDVIDMKPDLIDSDDIGPVIKKFVDSIDNYIRKHSDTEFEANFDKILEVIEKVEINIREGVTAYSKLSEDNTLSDSASNYQSLLAKHDSLKAQIKELKDGKKVRKVNIEKIEEEIDIVSFRTAIRQNYPDSAKLSLNDFGEHIKSLETKTRTARNNLTELQMKSEAKEKIIEELKSEKRPQFSTEKDIITDLSDELNSVIFNTGNQFKTYFKNITSSKSDVENESEEKFRQSLFRYISTKTPTINHAGKDYEVELIDPIKKTIKTKDDRIIDFQSFGTGRSQSASLLNKINSLDPSKKNIVLFDEIAHMDNQSLQPIKDRLKELYENGTIFIAILVQKADEIKVSPLLN